MWVRIMGTPHAGRLLKERNARLAKEKAEFEAEKARRSVGTPLTDFGKEKRALETNLLRPPGRNQQQKTFKEIDTIIGQQLTKPALLADEKAIGRKKRKKTASDRLQSGRASTILDDTLG